MEKNTQREVQDAAYYAHKLAQIKKAGRLRFDQHRTGFGAEAFMALGNLYWNEIKYKRLSEERVKEIIEFVDDMKGLLDFWFKKNAKNEQRNISNRAKKKALPQGFADVAKRKVVGRKQVE